MTDSDNTQTLVLMFVFAFASLLHGISGLGVTLVTTSALASMYSLPDAIILVIFPSLLLNAMTWLIGGGRSIWQNFIYYGRRYWLLASTSLLGSMIGAKLLLIVDSAY
ncbi:MAG: sulfite exporter TauE/SafE family protein, partial [Psychrobacter sp.]|nr:sulfite exporter TauE/SafE family protein [Psychrobacter sp.]